METVADEDSYGERQLQTKSKRQCMNISRRGSQLQRNNEIRCIQKLQARLEQKQRCRLGTYSSCGISDKENKAARIFEKRRCSDDSCRSVTKRACRQQRDEMLSDQRKTRRREEREVDSATQATQKIERNVQPLAREMGRKEEVITRWLGRRAAIPHPRRSKSWQQQRREERLIY